MKQTAVEYLDERYTYIKWLRDRDEISSETGIKWYNEALKQAKQMEKEQIVDAFNQGMNNSVDYFIPEDDTTEATEYYNETYKNEAQTRG